MIVEPGGALDEADRVDFAHIGGIVGADQDVVGAVLVDEILQLVMGVDERVEIKPFEVCRRHLFQMHAGVGPRRCGVVDAPRIGRQIAAAMGDDELQIGMVLQHPAKDQMMHRDRRIERVADHIGEVMVLEAARPVTLPASGPDVFWNFIFSPMLKTKRFVRAIEIRPGNQHVVHHANVIVDREESARHQEIDPGAGFPGMDLKIMRTTFDFDSHFLFWKPGSMPWVEPEGLAWQLNPGDDLVLNAHLRPTGNVEQVKPSIGLYFTDRPPDLFPMLIQLEDDAALDIPPGDRDFVVSDRFRIPLDVEVLAVYPHAHYLGHLLEGYATLPNGERKWLIRIQDWDPSWQAVYHYREPIRLPRGTIISMRYHYDNSAGNPRNPNHPPRRVQGGNMAMDEMGHLWLQVLPLGPGDRRRELEEALMRHRLEKHPSDVQARVMLGALMLSRLDPAGAVTILEEAVQMDPKQSRAHNLLGAALTTMGRLPEASAQFRAALEIEPSYTNARYNLAKTLAKTGQLNEAFGEFQQVLSAVPQDAHVYNDVGELLVRMGKPGDAVGQFDKALSLDPSLEAARKNRQLALRQLPQQ